MKFAAFDLEITKILPENTYNLMDHAPLGISCAAAALSDRAEPIIWQGVPGMDRAQCQAMVAELGELVAAGYQLVTWNGCAFDFQVLAQESGMVGECGALALNHVDLMLLATFTKGYFLGLDKVLQGAGIKGKVKQVQLKDGSVMRDMGGGKAPELWAQGEHEAVLTYLRGDVLGLLELVEVVQRKKRMNWKSNRGNPQNIRVPKLLTVKACFSIPEPDVSWMSNPPRRKQFVDWIPDWERQVFGAA
jgi:hypothetical protein